MVKSDALQIHLKSLNSAASFKPLYIFSGDEPLLMMEAMDQLRATAKKMAYTDREVLLQERGFDWSALLSAGQTMSLFGDKRWVELRIPTGKHGRDGRLLGVWLLCVPKHVDRRDANVCCDNHLCPSICHPHHGDHQLLVPCRRCRQPTCRPWPNFVV